MRRDGGKWSEVSVNYESGQLAPDNVRRMFDRIAPVYDAMNRTMTAGLDRRWRRLTAEAVVRPGDEVLDACCGTGDLAIAELKRLVIDVKSRVGIDLHHTFGSPVLQEPGRAGVLVRLLVVARLIAVEFQADEIRRMLLEQLVLKLRRDHVVRRRHHVAQ